MIFSTNDNFPSKYIYIVPLGPWGKLGLCKNINHQAVRVCNTFNIKAYFQGIYYYNKFLLWPKMFRHDQ